uniref:Uncharacterized protein n=1 Tax=Rhizophora mucronata TaxID=61149 RepID=A0A2P2PA45_RHIMU
MIFPLPKPNLTLSLYSHAAHLTLIPIHLCILLHVQVQIITIILAVLVVTVIFTVTILARMASAAVASFHC